jgi:hypothetical protein
LDDGGAEPPMRDHPPAEPLAQRVRESLRVADHHEVDVEARSVEQEVADSPPDKVCRAGQSLQHRPEVLEAVEPH